MEMGSPHVQPVDQQEVPELDRLTEFAAKHYGADEGKTVPLGLLKAWLFEHHFHVENALCEDGMYRSGPYVHSMGLSRWAEYVVAEAGNE